MYLEIDRSVQDVEDQTSKEIRLFSLKLQPTCNLFGFQYACLGTVNYMLEDEDGGHYVTYLFPSPSECLKIHETESKCQWRRPDFDTETVLIAFQQTGNYLLSTTPLPISIQRYFFKVFDQCYAKKFLNMLTK